MSFMLRYSSSKSPRSAGRLSFPPFIPNKPPITPERVQAKLVPLVGDLEEVRRGIEKLQKQRDAAGWSWAVLAVICSGLGGIVGGLVVLAFCR